MHTEVVKITESNTEEILSRAAQIIKNGGLVVFPTETVYGLGANALDATAVAKIFVAKGRPSDNPLIVHVCDKEQLDILVENISPVEQKLMDKFWPGPLTLVLPKKKEISQIISGGLETIAVRMPNFEIALQLLKKSGVPIAAPSANISGRPSATSGEVAHGDLVGKVDMIIDAGNSEIGLESTVVKVTSGNVLILRPGAVTLEMIKEVVDPMPVSFAHNKADLESSPGTKYKHYAPEAKLEILSLDEINVRAEKLSADGLVVGIITSSNDKNMFQKYEPNVFSVGDKHNLEEISKTLYASLRFFDTYKVDTILCESFSDAGLGKAIMDRLTRASL